MNYKTLLPLLLIVFQIHTNSCWEYRVMKRGYVRGKILSVFAGAIVLGLPLIGVATTRSVT